MIARAILALGLLGCCAAAQTKLSNGVLRYDKPASASPSLWQHIQKEWGWIVASRPFGRSVALLVGVGNYQFIEPKLRYVGDDLKEMREFLLGPGGFDTVYVLQDADDVNLVEEYMSNEFPKTLSSEDRLLFYFSGHGADRANIGYMQFAKARSDRYDASQYLDVTRCERWSHQIPAKHILFVIDACNSGLGFDAKTADAPRVDEDLLRLFSGDGSRVVMTAGIGKEKSFQVDEGNKGGYSVFTRAFLDAIRHTESASGFLILDEVMAGLRRNVAVFSRGSPARQMTPRLWQIPRQAGKDKGSFVFLNPKVKAPPIPSPLKQYVKVTLKDGEFPLPEVRRAGPLPEGDHILSVHDGAVSSVVFSPDGRLLASASADQTIRLWNVTTGERVSQLSGTGSLYAAAFNLDGRQLASAGDDGIQLWDVTTGELIRTFVGHVGTVARAVFSPNGTLLASGGEDQTIRLWKVTTGETIAKLVGCEGTVVDVAFSPNGKFLASASFDHTIRLWNISTGKPVLTLKDHYGVGGVAFSPDGKFLASAGKAEVMLWNVDSGEEIRTMTESPRDVSLWVLRVAFSRDGKLLAASTDKGTIQLWDLATGRNTRTLAGHSSEVYSIAFSPDGRLLASGSKDGTVRLWKIK